MILPLCAYPKLYRHENVFRYYYICMRVHIHHITYIIHVHVFMLYMHI